ncbi:hypothetical protein ILYODFUR_036485 [Ilyodon furcidens]|uniref:Uncharacterized protein n=1 Tax=Ilyodon furcidens TaxID=33524 RepID=A0ABV0SS38_9TELE
MTKAHSAPSVAEEWRVALATWTCMQEGVQCLGPNAFFSRAWGKSVSIRAASGALRRKVKPHLSHYTLYNGDNGDQSPLATPLQENLAVFEHLNAANLTVKSAKCTLAKKEIEYWVCNWQRSHQAADSKSPSD